MPLWKQFLVKSARDILSPESARKHNRDGISNGSRMRITGEVVVQGNRLWRRRGPRSSLSSSFILRLKPSLCELASCTTPGIHLSTRRYQEIVYIMDLRKMHGDESTTCVTPAWMLPNDDRATFVNIATTEKHDLAIDYEYIIIARLYSDLTEAQHKRHVALYFCDESARFLWCETQYNGEHSNQVGLGTCAKRLR